MKLKIQETYFLDELSPSDLIKRLRNKTYFNIVLTNTTVTLCDKVCYNFSILYNMYDNMHPLFLEFQFPRNENNNS